MFDSIDVKNEYSNFYPSVSVGHGVHGDEDGAAGVQRELHPLELEALDVVGHGVLDGVDLLGHHGQHPHLYPGHRHGAVIIRASNEGLRRFHNQGSSRFQSGEGPICGFLCDYEPSCGPSFEALPDI